MHDVDRAVHYVDAMVSTNSVSLDTSILSSLLTTPHLHVLCHLGQPHTAHRWVGETLHPSVAGHTVGWGWTMRFWGGYGALCWYPRLSCPKTVHEQRGQN